MYRPQRCPGISPFETLEQAAIREAAIEKQERELLTKASLVRYQVCQPKCNFSRTCSKRGQKILDCETVKKWQAAMPKEASP